MLAGFHLLQASKAFIRKSSVFRFINNPVKNYPKSGLIPNSDVSARYIRFRLKRDWPAKLAGGSLCQLTLEAYKTFFCFDERMIQYVSLLFP